MNVLFGAVAFILMAIFLMAIYVILNLAWIGACFVYAWYNKPESKMKSFSAALFCLTLASCANVPTPDGRMVLLGGDHAYRRMENGEVRYVGKLSKSFRDAMIAATGIAGSVASAATAKAQEATSQTQIIQGQTTARQVNNNSAATDQLKIITDGKSRDLETVTDLTPQ